MSLRNCLILHCRSEFLGKIGIPLFKIESGKRRWYALKDKKLRCRAKGSNPQIQLELTLYWNAVRAAVRTLNPKDKRYMDVAEKFKRQVHLILQCSGYFLSRC